MSSNEPTQPEEFDVQNDPIPVLMMKSVKAKVIEESEKHAVQKKDNEELHSTQGFIVSRHNEKWEGFFRVVVPRELITEVSNPDSIIADH